MVDPAVSRRKFAREVEAAKSYAPFQGQGVWILRAEYPIVFVVLVINKPFPITPGVLCGLHLDFTDYDVSPPSVQIVNPFDETPVPFDACWKFPRVNNIVAPAPGQPAQELQLLLQAFNHEKPFFCHPGVREYHECSAHSGDSWFLHRKPNFLIYLLSVLHRYGPNAAGLQIVHQLVPKAVT